MNSTTTNAINDSQRVVLITGCTPGGIGHALTKEFYSRGLHVIATARSSTALSSLEDINAGGIGKVSVVSLDVTNTESIQAAKEKVTELTGGRLDILVNNAGTSNPVPFLDTPIPDAEFLFATNVFGVMRMTQAFTPLLIDTAAKISSSYDTSLRRTPLPVIVQIGSVAAVTPYVFGSIYNASKGALHSFSNTFRVEIKPFGVRVCTIITGGVQSNIAVMRSDHSSITAPHTARDPTPVLKPELLRPLPETSLYLPIQEYYNRRQRHSQEGAMPAAAYAKVVVDEALKKNPKDEIWTGKSSSLVWFIMTFIGRWMLDRRMEKVFGLRQLALLVKRGWSGNGKTI